MDIKKKIIIASLLSTTAVLGGCDFWEDFKGEFINGYPKREVVNTAYNNPYGDKIRDRRKKQEGELSRRKAELELINKNCNSNNKNCNSNNKNCNSNSTLASTTENGNDKADYQSVEEVKQHLENMIAQDTRQLGQLDEMAPYIFT
ncbi:MAG: hypothetical protein EU981_02495 [Candidatus Liberibacter ctenarytainae]|uniref:Lipoprotein n=1 Tax=Candidatus Liberibacter ctenarytainae TaxID=2020335 RepID=A0A937DGZ9_9HYPH|nr:hypothetical protein [Candidatus Liberibacter ctenarytainae]